MANVALPATHIQRRVLTGVFTEGRVHTVPANLSAGDTMEVGFIPAGGRLVGAKVKSDSAISGTIDLGTVATADLYMDGDNSLAAAEGVASADEGLGDVVAVDTLVRITFLTAAPALGDVITAWLEVTFDNLDGDVVAAV